MVYVNRHTRFHWQLGYELTFQHDSIVRAIHNHGILPVQPSLYAVACVAGSVELSRGKKTSLCSLVLEDESWIISNSFRNKKQVGEHSTPLSESALVAQS